MLEILFYFLIYSFIGWIIETIYIYYTTGKLMNRGFLIGPWVPIYGVGCLMVTYLLYPRFHKLIPFFLISTFVIAVLEYVTSYVMEKVFKARWWDYSDKKYNVNGRICLQILLSFGTLSSIAVYIVNPLLVNMFNTYQEYCYFMSIILIALFSIDALISCTIIFKIKGIMFDKNTDNTEEITNRVKQLLIKVFKHNKV